MNMPALNFKRLAGFAQNHLGALFIVFTLAVAGATGVIFARAVLLLPENPATAASAKTNAVNVNRAVRNEIFSRLDQRTAGVGAALTMPVKDPF